MAKLKLYLLLALLITACGGGDSPSNPPPNTPPTQQTRPFMMGFTPWLYEASFTAQDYVYDQIQVHGDIISHHLMDGIPWQAAYDQTAYPTAVENEINTRLAKTLPNTKVYLSIDSLTSARNELIHTWGATGTEPRTGAWATRSFDSPEVIEAYGNFALDMIDRFKPDYFNYAVEVSELMVKNPTEFDRFVSFAQAIYTRVKAAYPDLTILVSLSLRTPNSNDMQITTTQFPRIADYVDMAGISIYPYVFFNHADKGNPDNLPTGWLSQISNIAPGKPVAITETGWAAEDLIIPNFSVNVPATADDQQRYTAKILAEAEQLNAAFVIWFCIADYDTLWSTLLANSDEGRIWRDIGLLDGNLNTRASFQDWQTWFARTYTP